MKIYPYMAGSQSAKALAGALNVKRIRRTGKPIRGKGVVINWGASRIDRHIECNVLLNPPASVAMASNKLQAFKQLSGRVSTPDWTESPVEASKWLVEGFAVMARTVLRGHSGEGIVLIDPEGELVDAPLYVKYIPKKEEYRIHVFQGDAFFVQRKVRNRDIPDENVNWQVRNHKNGFVFAHQNVEVSEEGKQQAIMAVEALDLDFGAVDVIKGSKDGKWYVLEVNTACGLSGETINRYAEQFRKYDQQPEVIQ